LPPTRHLEKHLYIIEEREEMREWIDSFRLFAKQTPKIAADQLVDFSPHQISTHTKSSH